MRLLYLTRTYTSHDARWLRVLAENGLALAFLPLQRVNAEEFSRAHLAVELLTSPALRAGATTTQLDGAESCIRAQIETWRPDVIMAGPLTDAGYLAVRCQPERTLLMSWAFDVWHEPSVLPGARERLSDALRRGHHLFADCQSVADQCEALAGRKYKNVCVLPWGLAATDKPTLPTPQLRTPAKQAAKVILYTRGFESVHQPEVILAAFQRAQAENESLRLWMAGKGPMREPLEAMVAASGLGSVVRFLGELSQPELAGCFAAADAYVACSLSDGSSLSLLQAMHAGLPCVVADLPGNREWLEPDGGWLVPVAEPEALARAMIESTRLSTGDRAEIATRNRGWVEQRADLRANLPRLLRALGHVAGRCEPAASLALAG